MAPKPSRITEKISRPRVPMRRRAAATERSISARKRSRSTGSWVKACTVRSALTVSSA